MTDFDGRFSERLISRNARIWAIPTDDGFLVADGNQVLKRVRGTAPLYELVQAIFEELKAGPKSLRGICEPLGCLFPPLLITKAIEKFIQVGVLEFWDSNDSAHSASVAASHVVVVAPDPLCRGMTARLDNRGFGSIGVVSIGDTTRFESVDVEQDLADYSSATFCVAIGRSEVERLQLFPAVNRACLKRGIPWLSGHLDASSMYIGPLFVPRETGCHACLEAREDAHDTRSPERSAMRAYARSNIADLEFTFEPLFLDSLLDLLALEVVKVVMRTSFPPTYQTMIEVSRADYRTQHHTLLRLPTCDTCGPFATQPFRLAWDL